MHHLQKLVVMALEVASTEFKVIYLIHLIYWHGVGKRSLIKLNYTTPMSASQTQHLFDTFPIEPSPAWCQ